MYSKWRMRLFLTLLGLSSVANAASSQVFVSFSMPYQLLIETLRDAARLNIPVTLNGLHHNSMQETIELILKLTNEVPSAALQIDPTAFERFGIHQVPALVVEANDCFDVIYGNLPLEEGLSRIQHLGQCSQQGSDL